MEKIPGRLKSSSTMAVIITGLMLVGYIAYLVGNYYHSQVVLQQMVMDQIAADSERRALAVRYFYAEREGDLGDIAESREVTAYFENKALGMSMEYGLRASIKIVTELMGKIQQNKKLADQVIFERIVFLDDAGRRLSDTGSASLREDHDRNWRQYLSPSTAKSAIFCDRQSGEPRIIVSVPCLFKGHYGGQVLGWIPAGLVYHYFVKGNEHASRYPVAILFGREYLNMTGEIREVIPADTRYIPADFSPGQTYRFSMPGSGSDRAAVNVILVPVKGTPLSLMTVLPASGRFDFRAPRQLLFSTAGLAALILAGMFFLLRLDMRNAVLRARLEEVTLREQTEIALRKSEDEYRSLFETSRDAILIADHSGYLDCNQASCALFGCKSKEDLIGKHPGEFSPELQPDGRNSFAEANEKISATIEKGIQFFEWVHKRHDGTTFPAEVLLSSSEFSGRPVVQAAIRDISERKILEEQLHHSQKMEAIGKLAGGIAHDFNNILTAIIGFSNLIKMKMKPDDPMHLEMDQVLAAADKAANLTRSLLVFSRKQVINQQSIDLNGIIRNLDKFMKRIIGEDVDLVLRLADKKLVVFADSGQLEQVLINLATNACDAMPQGGALTITTTSIEVDGGFADTRSLVKAGKYALLTVTDTGTGMDEETQQRIFEPFFTTKEFGKGTGLGLAVSYGIINQHNGYISVASAPDQGTTFSIYLPFGNELLVPGVRTIEPPPRGGVETILYAEDDDTIREMATQIMQDAGYQVIAARDGEEAVKGFMAHQDTINLLLFDLVMPKKNGKVASDEIRQIRPDIRTLFVSGYTADLLQRKGLYEEGLKLVMKPLAPAELLRQIRDILDREPKV